MHKSIPTLYNYNERHTHGVSAQHSMLAASILRNGRRVDLGCSPWVIYRALFSSSRHPRSETALGVSKAAPTPDQTDVAQLGGLIRNYITLLSWPKFKWKDCLLATDHDTAQAADRDKSSPNQKYLLTNIYTFCPSSTWKLLVTPTVAFNLHRDYSYLGIQIVCSITGCAFSPRFRQQNSRSKSSVARFQFLALLHL